MCFMSALRKRLIHIIIVMWSLKNKRALFSNLNKQLKTKTIIFLDNNIIFIIATSVRPYKFNQVCVYLINLIKHSFKTKRMSRTFHSHSSSQKGRRTLDNKSKPTKGNEFAKENMKRTTATTVKTWRVDNGEKDAAFPATHFPFSQPYPADCANIWHLP